jgi:predicted nucleic acid-binding protein
VIVVSDTSPLNYLILINAVDVLPLLFNEVYTTKAVLKELTHPKAPELVRRWAQLPPSWLKVAEPVNILPSTIKLDPGEATALSLAKERSIVNILIDEAKGTKVATQEKLFPIPTLAIVEIGVEKKLLERSAIEKLRHTNLRCPQELFDAALERDRLRCQ